LSLDLNNFGVHNPLFSIKITLDFDLKLPDQVHCSKQCVSFTVGTVSLQRGDSCEDLLLFSVLFTDTDLGEFLLKVKGIERDFTLLSFIESSS
jgi:hypothetical protein